MTPTEYNANKRQAEKELLQLKNDMLVDINTAFQEQVNTQQSEITQLSSQYQFLVTSAGGVITLQGRTIDNLKLEVSALRGVVEDNDKAMDKATQTVLKYQSTVSILETTKSNYKQQITSYKAILKEKEDWHDRIRNEAKATAKKYHDWNENQTPDVSEIECLLTMLHTLEAIAKG